MGNQSLKTAFKGHLKNEIAENKCLHMNSEFLFENDLIEIIYEKVKKEKIRGDFDINSSLKETNNQINSHCEDIGFKKLIAEIDKNITAGFSSTNANIQQLSELDYDKFFTVYCPIEVTEYTILQQKKFFILYNLYVEKFKDTRQEGAGFFDFIRRFFEEKDTTTDRSEATQISIQGGLKFSIHLLKELQNIAPDLLKTSLKYLYETYRNASPQSLYGVEKTFFIVDQTLNEAREFLVQIIQNKQNNEKEIKELAIKLLLVIGIMRSNVEDFVLAINLIEMLGLQIDISEEISRVNFDIEETALNPKFYQEIEKIKADGNLFYLQKLIPNDKLIKKNIGFTTDERFFYLHSNFGLLKIGNGEQDQMLGNVYIHKQNYRINEKCKLVFYQGKLLCRSKSEKKKPLLVLDPETLEETSQQIKFPKNQIQSLEWVNDKENNRYMNETPLFTDSNYLYAISYSKPEKDDDEEEEKEEGQQENLQQQQQNQDQQRLKQKKSEEQAQFYFNVEIYELSKEDLQLKFLRTIQLKKDKDNFYQKSKIILKRASFVSNGKILIIIFKRKMSFFDLATGLRLAKANLDDQLTQDQDGVVTYDVRNHRLWYLNRKEKELYSFITPNFKRVVKEESIFKVKYLKKRVQAVRTKNLPQTKSVKEKQLDNVMTALGLQTVKSVVKEDGQMPIDESTLDENKFLIMSLLGDSANALERERPQIHWNPKKYEITSKRLLSQFKSPFVTNLTPYFFEKLAKLLSTFVSLIDESKTTKTIEQQYSFYFTLKVLKSNLISLTICEIDLKDIIKDENIYNEFYKQFKNTVVTIIEKSFKNEFQNQEISLLWKEIYDECLLSMSMGLGMIYNSFSEINTILKKSLKDLDNPKNKEYALLVITNFARHETIRKLINNENNFEELIQIFSDIIKIQTDKAIQILDSTDFPLIQLDLQQTDLERAVFQFVQRFYEKFLVFYTEYKDNSLSQKKYMESFMITLFELISSQCSMIGESVKSLLLRFYKYVESNQNSQTSKYEEIQVKSYCQKILCQVSSAYNILALYISAFSTMEIDIGVMSPISNNVIDLIDILCNYFNQIKAKERDLSKILNPSFTVESTHPYVYEVKDPVLIQCKGAEKFTLSYSSKSRFPPMEFLKAIKILNPQTKQELMRITNDTKTYSSQAINNNEEIEIEFEYNDIKQNKLEYLIGHEVQDCYGFQIKINPDFTKGQQDLNEFFDQILRQCSWLIGRLSYNLIKITQNDKETEEEKNYKLLLHSKIFSGGFENRYLYLFRQRTVRRLIELTDITKDKDIIPYLISEQSNSEVNEDKILKAIIHENVNKSVDNLISILQKHFQKTVIWGSVGGLIGERMVRAAFAPMIKFSQLSEDFNLLAQEAELLEEVHKEIQVKKEKEQKILQELKQNKKFEQLTKRWAVASRMRTFYQEMKKSISEAIEKKRMKHGMQQPLQNESSNHDLLEDQEMIDTSTHQINEIPQFMRRESSYEAEKLERDIHIISQRIQEKSELLIKLSVPNVWEQKSNEEDNNIVMIRTTTDISDKKHEIQMKQNDNSKPNTQEWKRKLHQWKQIQQSKGAIKSLESVNQNKIFDSLSGSVLQCLQSSISIKRLRKSVEQVYLNASQRIAGFCLIGKLMAKQLPHIFDLINWFCSSLRGNTNQLTHYIDDIRGCGNILEEQARKHFFVIIKGLLEKLVESKDDIEIRQILNSLKWNYSASDHKMLGDLKIFKILRDGNQQSQTLQKLWGSKFSYEFYKKDNATQEDLKKKLFDRMQDIKLLNMLPLSKEVLDLFEFILLTSLGTSIKPRDTSDLIKIKDANKLLMPSLERVQSVINVDQTSQLLKQAYDIIFKELQRFVEFAQRFEGINWKTYVRLMNRFRKTGSYFKDEAFNILMQAKEMTQAVEVSHIQEDQYGQEDDYYDQEEYEGGEDFELGNESYEERLFEEIELGKYNEFYNSLYVQKLLQMINSLASVSGVNAYASHVLFNISHPNRIGTLIGILFNGSASLKVLVIKIFEHLVKILPPELFEESVKIVVQNQLSNQSQILKSIKTITNIGEANQFTKLLFSYLINIRNKIWIRKYESPGMYGISNAISNLLRKMFENSIWRHLHESELKTSINLLTKLPYQEKEAILSLFSADLQGLTVGTTALDKNDNKAQTNRVIGLYLNENTLDQNEILILDPQELVLIHEEKNTQNQLPIKDLLMEKDLLKNLINEGIISLSKGQDLTIEEQNFKVSITKIIFSLMNERQEQFIDFLKQQQMGSIFNDFLNLLFDESCKILKTPITLQLDWVEQKCFEIRKQACESKCTLSKHLQLQGQVVIDKVFFSFNSTNKEKQFNDYDLVGALNYDNIVDMQLKVGFYQKEDSFKTPEFLIISGPDLYTEDGLIKFGESEITLTCDLNLDEYLVFLDRQERKVKGVSDKPLIMVDKEDFEEIQSKYKKLTFFDKNDIKEDDHEKLLEQQAQIISDYSGFETTNILKSLKTLETDIQLNQLMSNLVKREQKRKEAELKKLQQKDKPQGNNQEEEENENEKVQEDFNQTKKELTHEEKQKKIFDKELREKEEIHQLVLELVNEDKSKDLKFDLKERLKCESSKHSELFKNIKSFTQNNIHKQYQDSLSLLFTLYSRRILQKVVTIKFEETIPLMMNSKERKLQFKQFLKIISNEAVFVKFNTRNKKLLVKINELLKRVVIKCQQDEQYQTFIDELFQFDVMKASKDLIKSLKNEKIRSIRVLFSSEQKATRFSNPYFILAICRIFLEHCTDYILKEDQLPTLIEQLLTLSYLFSQDPELKIQINEFILNVLEIVQKHYNKLSLKLKTQLQQMWMLKDIVEKLTFSATNTTAIYHRHQLLLLEILMKLLHLKKVSKKDIHSIYSKNETILQIQRAKDVLKETNSYKLLQYLLHYEKLSPEQQTIKHSFETTHKMFDTKFSCQFKIDEIEKMVLSFDKNTEIEPDTAVAITRDEEGKEVLDVIFSSEITNSYNDIFDENVFMHYPCKPYTIYAFGDCTHGKLGINQQIGCQENPTIIKKVYHKVKDVQTFNTALVIQLEDDSLHKVGYKEQWPQENKHIVQKWDKKATTFSLGCRHTLIVDDRGKLYGEGMSNQGSLGIQSYENKNWVSISFKEKIHQISCGYDYSFIVSKTGNLYCAGAVMLVKLNLPNQNKFEKIDLGSSVKVEKVVSAYTQMALIIVKNQGMSELWSAGYNIKGALGSGENVVNKSSFGRVAYDSSLIEFVDIDIYSEHASAITKDGELYQWGWNHFGRCGHRDYEKQIFQPNLWEPKKVEFFNNYIVREAKCGQCHTVVLASPKDFPEKNEVFTYGREGNEFHFLGIPKEESIKEDQFIIHLKRFDHLKPYKVEAGLKCTLVCCEGEEELFQGRYYHKEAKCDSCHISQIQGPLHFTNEENKFNYWCDNCVKSGKAILPKVTFAIKNQINEMEKKVWPNLKQIEENLEEGGKDFLCDFNKSLFSTNDQSLYLSFSKLLESIDEFRLCQESFFKSNCNDLNPIIYLRIEKGYSPINLEKFPIFNLQEFYQKSDYYGLRFQLLPDFQYTINQKILEETKDQYLAVQNEMKIFDSKLDEELYKFIEDYQYQHRDTALKDINEKVLEINEKRFSDKLKKIPESLKRKRLRLLLQFNRYAQQLIPFIDYNTKLSLEASARLNAYFMKAKEFIMYGVKSQYQTNYINKLQVDNQKKDININRMKAGKFFECGRTDHTGEYTVFGQVFKGLKASKYSCLRVNNSSDRAFNAKFIGEGSIDVGGPYRETIYEICKGKQFGLQLFLIELQSHALPLLIKTQNQKNDFGEHRDKWIPNSSMSSPSHLAMFEFLGALIGMSIRCSQILNLNFPSLFWKKLIDEPLDRSDLNMIDTYCLQMLDGIKNLAQTLPEKEFQEYNDQKFVTCLSDGSEIELVPGGKNKILTQDNVDDYIQLVMNARLNEFEKQMKSIKRGIGLIFPQFLMKIYTWKELEYKVCGKPSIDLHHLKAISKYSGCSEDDETVKRFWRVLESFSDEEKSLYLKFVWGRSRLPLVDEKFGDKHTIKLINPQNCDQSLPIAHTCFFAIDIPMYSTEEIMRDKFLYAIKFCQAIDTDGSPYEILGEDSDGDF